MSWWAGQGGAERRWGWEMPDDIARIYGVLVLPLPTIAMTWNRFHLLSIIRVLE